MPREDDSTAAERSTDRATGWSRRNVLQGTAAFAGAGLVPHGGGGRPISELVEGAQVPEEPADGGQVRRFTVHAVEVDIVYNRFGLHQPNGAMYVLEENLDAVREASGEVPGDAFALVDDDERRRLACDHQGGDGHDSADGSKTATDGGQCVRDDRHRHEHDGHDDHQKGHQKSHGHANEGHHKSGHANDGHHDGHGPDYDRDDDQAVDTSIIEPLVIRANEGDVIEIEFVNDLDRRASIHQTALPYEVEESDGMNVGFNPDTTVAPGESLTYRWFASHRGGHFFFDGANQAYDSADEPPEEANLASRGLFGTMVVEPPGATWTDPETGEDLRSGVRADVHDPEFLGTSYREFVIHYHTPEGIVNPDGELTWPGTDVEQTTHAINYRADPTGNRVNDECPDCDEEEYFYNSWTNGDPGGGDNVYETYKGDSIKFVPVGASLEEHHVHHLHNHRWKQIPNEVDSDTLDSQTIGMGATFPAYFTVGAGENQGTPLQGDEMSLRPDYTFEEAFEIGAGYAHGGTGDVLFHCHLFPHYGEGMWAIMRVHDKERDDLEVLPGTEVVDDPDPDDLPLPTGQILGADSDVPGYPEFVPGEVGQAPPERPGPGPNDRDPTAEEELVGELLPGAPYTDPCNPDDIDVDAPVREYTIVALDEVDIVYNDNGDHDPEGIVYALEEDAERIKKGKQDPEPLFIRANLGECVEITLRNETDRPISVHPHFVGFDVLGSDSLATGYNYDQDTDPGEERRYRWFADEEGMIFFHDHIFGIDDVMHGEFCGLIVEPEDSEWLDPNNGEPIESGAQAIISAPNQPDFREFCLHYHDFAQLIDPDTGEFVNPDFEHNENAGVMAINYRNTPLYQRNDPDPAYAYSSAVHGDPSTPPLEAYENDPVRFRVVQGAYEEQHNFQLHGRILEPEGLAEQDTVSEHLGTSEAFTFFVDPDELRDDRFQFEPVDNPDGLPVRDYLYGTGIIDDRWTGMWGIHRLFGAEVPHLEPLPDRGTPDGRISEDDLREMGHPAPFIGLDRFRKFGQRARLIYQDRAKGHKSHRGNSHGSERRRSNGHGGPHAHDGKKSHDHGDGKTAHDGHDDRRPKRGAGAHRFPPDKHARRNRNVGEIPPQAPDPGDPCPDDSPVRSYDITAIRTDIEFNDYGDHDPFGIVFTYDEFVEDVRNGDRSTPPLKIRANRGDCIEINLTNGLPGGFGGFEGELRQLLADLRGTGVSGDLLDTLESLLDVDGFDTAIREALEDVLTEVEDTEDAPDGAGTRLSDLLDRIDSDEPGADHAHPQMRVTQPWDPSDRISLHPQRIKYDVNGSDGATVGFNYDQTAAPGETITYRWYAEGPLDNVVLWDEADIRSNRHHGAFAALVIEPEGSTWLDPRTAEPLPAGSGAIITNPNGQDVREFALSMSDGRYIINRFDPDSCVVPPGFDPEIDPDDPCNQLGDPEDQGYQSLNNRCEPFIRRFETGPDDQHLVYSSEVHGDPATPVFRALLDEPIKFLVHQTADKARGCDFHLAGHQWRRFSGIENSPIIGVDDRFTPGRADRLDLIGNAGGLAGSSGDFIYQADLKERRRLEAGFWGIFRVRDTPTEFDGPVQPLPEMATETSLTPEDRPGWTVARGDTTGSGDEDVVVGVPDSTIGGEDAGAVYWFEGPVDEGDLTDLTAATAAFYGSAGERVGTDVSITDGAVSTAEDTGSDDLVVGTDTDATYVVAGGESLAETLADPPETAVAELLANTTNSSIDVAVTIGAVATEESTE